MDLFTPHCQRKRNDKVGFLPLSPRLALILLLIASLLFAGCTPSLPLVSTQTPFATSPISDTPASSPLSPTQPATGTVAPSGPVTLRIWLPPQFNPDLDTPAGVLLRQRFEAFKQRRPDVRIEVRIKGENGPAGLLESLTAASSAAPIVLPDLIALPRPVLETAALKGLLHPFDGLSDVMDKPDWYDYARQMSRVQNSTFGLPFAGDALLLAYRPEKVSEPPSTWQAVVEGKGPLAFPAGDPQALFALTLYQSVGGSVRDDQGRPALDQKALTRVFTFFQNAETSGAMPYWLTQYQDDDQAWQGFQDGHADMIATWSSRYLTNPVTDTAIAPLPSAGGSPFTLANGWVWALVGSPTASQEKAVELAQFLTEVDFLAAFN